MLAFIPVAVLAALAPVASALTITSPTSGGWTGNSSVLISWTYTQDDPSFSVELGNPKIQSGLLAQGPIAVANNIAANTQSFTFELPVLPPGDNYFVAFVAIDNVNNVYANSSSFPIRANPTSSTVALSSVKTSAAGTKTSSSHLASTTGRNSTVSSTSTGSLTTNTITSSSGSSTFTVLSITPLNPSTTASTTSTKGAASRIEAAWYVGFATAFLGAFLA